MIGVARQDQHYSVEVSGWNSAENFFVEKTSLEWSPEGSKSVRLKTELRPGTIVFLRLLEYGPIANQFPVAYQTSEHGSHDSEGRVRVSLQQMRPRETRHSHATPELVGAT